MRLAVDLIDINGVKHTLDGKGDGIALPDGVGYCEIGDLPITVRYSDDGGMFPAAITVILEYCEAPARVTVRTLDGQRYDTKTLGGYPGHESVGLFRLYENKAGA